jgi:hypothetical protein
VDHPQSGHARWAGWPSRIAASLNLNSHHHLALDTHSPKKHPMLTRDIGPQASGVAVADNCVSSFNDLKLKHDRKYIVYKMNDKMTQIEVFKEGAKDATYDEFREALTAP